MTTNITQNDTQNPSAGMQQPVAPHVEQNVTSADYHQKALVEVPLAYNAYEGARKKLGDAFKGRTHHDRHAYKVAVHRYQAYELAMSKALRAREKAEQQSLELFRKNVERAIEAAGAVYRENLMQALQTCRHEIQQAWTASAETSDEMRSIFNGDEDNSRS